MKSLEAELGVQLFERSGRSPRLNASGRLVVERAEEILAIYEGIRGELSPAGEIGGTLTLGVVPTVLTGPLPPVLGRLRREHAGLNVRLLSGLSAELFRKVEEGELEATLSLVAEGLGIAVVPLNKKRLGQAGGLFSLTPFGSPPLCRRVGMYRRRRHPRHLLTELLLTELCRECGYISKS